MGRSFGTDTMIGLVSLDILAPTEDAAHQAKRYCRPPCIAGSTSPRLRRNESHPS